MQLPRPHGQNDHALRERVSGVSAVCLSFVLHAGLLILASCELPPPLPSQEPPAVLLIDVETVIAAPEHAFDNLRPHIVLQETVTQETVTQEAIAQEIAIKEFSPHHDRVQRQDVKVLPIPTDDRISKHKMAPPKLGATKRASSTGPESGISAAPSNIPSSWRSALLQHLNKHKRYPPQARQKRQTGVAILQFTMDRSGKVTTYHLLSKTGIDALDQEALAMIKRASPLPTIPQQITNKSLTLNVPVKFEL